MMRSVKLLTELKSLKKSNFNNPLLLKRFESTEKSSEGKCLKIGVQGAPFEKGQPKRGVADGPNCIRASGIIGELKRLGHDVQDFGNISVGNSKESRNGVHSNQSGPKFLDDVAKACEKISESTANIMNGGRLCLTLGGDHSIGLGTVHGANQVYPDLGVLWVDAHTDINTTATSDSGNMHGMPLSFLIKELQGRVTKYPQLSWVTPRLSAKNLAYIGLRDVDDGERAILEELDITSFTMKDVDRYGIYKVTEMALDKISSNCQRPLHVSFDVDALDDKEVSATGTPVPGGLTLREGITIVEEVSSSGTMVSMDLVELNPNLGDDIEVKRASNVAKHLILNAFGYKIR